MDESRFRDLLAEVAPRVPPVRRRQLATGVRELHQRILEHVLGVGCLPSLGEVAAWSTQLGAGPAESLATLTDADLVMTDPSGLRLLAAYPFSEPRGHRVEVDGRLFEATCAVDALGVPLMMGRPASIRSRDPLSGAEVRIDVIEREVSSRPAGAVVAIPVADACGQDSPPGDCMCPSVNFHASAEQADRFARHNDLALEVLTMEQAFRLAELSFSGLMDAG